MDLKDLNKEQKEAVEHGKGPLLIVAGAGTGKTTVLTRRIANFIKKGVAPEEILALTFTEKAANEMEERVEDLLEFGYYDFWISTFHSFCDRILRNHGLEIGISTNYKLLNETGAWILIKKNFDKFNFLKEYRPLGNPTKFIHALINHFKTCKNEGIYPEDYLVYVDSLKDKLDDDLDFLKTKEVAEAYNVYQQLLLDNTCLDFGDLINYTIKLFEKNEKILKKFQNQFKYVMVDEFQDTNYVQYELIKIILNKEKNITIVGDDDQSIFSFQGASFNNVIQFKNDFPNSKDIVLTENYRSNQNILDLAYEFIQFNNPNRLEHQFNQDKKLKQKAQEKGVDLNNLKEINKKLKSNIKGDGLIELLSFETSEEEIVGVVNKIWEIKEIDKEAKFSDFLVLTRTNSTADYFTRGFERALIPHNFISSKGLYSHPIILDMIAYLKVILDFYNSPSFYRVLRSLPLKLEPEEVAKISWFSEEKALPLFESVQSSKCLEKLSDKTALKLKKIVKIVKEHFELSKEKNVSELFVRMINDLDYPKVLNKPTEENLRNWEVIYQFFNLIKEFENTNYDGKLISFIENLNMEIEAGEEGSLKNSEIDNSDSVKIMTIHAAKGLEFKYVFITSMVQRKFPSDKKRAEIEIPEELIKEVLPNGDFHLQEERRLFYVALTRAKRGAFLTWASDYGGKRLKKPSRFLIESGLIKEDDAKNQKLKKEEFSFKRSFNAFKKESNETNGEKLHHILKDHFSFSQLASFQNCPLQYKYAHILKIPTKGKPVFSFGKTIHNSLYRFLKESNSNNNQTSIFNKDNSIYQIDDLMNIYKEEWIDAWFVDGKHREEYQQQGKKILKNFYRNFIEQRCCILEENDELFLEKTFKLKFGGNNFVGAIDRIDKIGENEVEIIDYKTGRAKKTLSTDEKFQLQIYNVAATRIFGLNAVKLSYYYLEDNNKLSFEPKKNDLEKTEEKIINIIEKIKRSKFKPTAGWQCQYCDYKDICPHRKI